ncbi:hypothetical protein Phum_PHUM183260 [Pediculus humanus corporis]|uniref:Uncharacterized protein n=1 Tax=Pediculus humanus subsp. corporis TaxID=121224 RepID=E0VGI1_PEDHC|nr:uncharacterized protein Phum_PHUM183260 [Pediculus humanus corporis]EEB12487.1 hypothetical protein Phum_PHUM183260 [Pediculus humanus corporis]
MACNNLGKRKKKGSTSTKINGKYKKRNSLIPKWPSLDTIFEVQSINETQNFDKEIRNPSLNVDNSLLLPQINLNQDTP